MPTYHEIAELIVAICAIGGFVKTLMNGRKINKMEVSIDGRLTQLLDISIESATAKGTAIGLQQGRDENIK